MARVVGELVLYFGAFGESTNLVELQQRESTIRTYVRYVLRRIRRELQATLKVEGYS